MPLLYHAYVYLEFLILACTIYILAPDYLLIEAFYYSNVCPFVFMSAKSTILTDLLGNRHVEITNYYLLNYYVITLYSK